MNFTEQNTVLLCSDEHNLYQLKQMEAKTYCIAPVKSPDYEIPDDNFLLLSLEHRQTENISIQQFLKIVNAHAPIKLIYCSLSAKEYFTMLYFVSLCKDKAIHIYDFSKQRSFQQDHIRYAVSCKTSHEIDVFTYQSAMKEPLLLTQKQKDNCSKLWLKLKNQEKLKCFIDPQAQTIQLLAHDAFDDKIKQLSVQRSFAECYDYFLTNYGLSEDWLISRMKKLRLPL